MLTQNLIIWYSAAVILGGTTAFVTVSIFRRLAPGGSTRKYWGIVAKNIHGLLYGEEDSFWAHYVSVIRETGKYVFQQLLALVCAFAPLVVAFFLLGPWIFAQWDRDAELAVFPEFAGFLADDQDRPLGDTADQARLVLADGNSVDLPSQAGPLAVCRPGRIACFVLQGFGFTVLTFEPNESSAVDLIIVRTNHSDWNPVWPYLSDPEFLFFVSLIFGSIVFFARGSKSKDSGQQEHAIGLVDYILTLLATRNMRLMRRWGDSETRRNRDRLQQMAVSKPVFIAGLARSGTTILLEKLAGVKGVATHRYRDFPFIMTPLVWNRFLRFFATKQAATERPHQDKIKITRDSPDAFEEPIWQHFFPYLHDASRSHILHSHAENADFERFYREHLQKILLLRNGARYLSKGNYNLSRIEYIGNIFPDALFVVPIRHPFTHVESLVRQHELFNKYADSDPKVPAYLRAVGHYEFGPQRVPIHMTTAGAEQIRAEWESGQDLLGYSHQWREVYEYVANLFVNNKQLAERIRVVRFEDLCRDPRSEFSRILTFTDLGGDESAARLADGIEASTHRCKMSPELRQQCWKIVEDVALRYGYSASLEDIPVFSGSPVSVVDS